MEKALLVVVNFGKVSGWAVDDLKDELVELAESSGAGVAGCIIARRESPTANLLVGKGKVYEIANFVKANSIDVVIFDKDLSSAQQRNLEEIIGTKTIDRTQLILDIFSRRARSNEGKIQVELAQLEYLLPRLAGKGIMLSRLGGGIGTRGPGEKKLESDRRRIKDMIARLKNELADIGRSRALKRKTRIRFSIPTVSLVGYTNAGKSTLFNALTSAHELVQDKLFSTLDPTTRRLTLGNNQKLILSDTVGFLHNLPHHLVESFKATLEEVVHADLLILVLDISHPKIFEHYSAVEKVLVEIGAAEKPKIIVLNKVDKLASVSSIKRVEGFFAESVTISALYKLGLDVLLKKITESFAGSMVTMKITIPYDKMPLLELVYKEGNVLKREERQEGIYLHLEVPLRLKDAIKKRLKM